VQKSILGVMVMASLLGSMVGCCGRDVHRGAGDSTMPAVASGLRVSIVVSDQRKILVRGDQPAIHVLIENTSDRPQGIIDEPNSMGYFNLSFEYTMSDGIRRTMKKNSEYVIWLRNSLEVTMLQPGEAVVWDVYFDPKLWVGLPTITQDTPVTMEAVFTQDGSNGPFTPKGEKPEFLDDELRAGCWMGTLRSAPLQATLVLRR
jgi:hypothetical protein